MNIKKALFAAVLAIGCMSASAQETKTIEVFKPHWYVQLQGGGQYTEGELDFKDLLSTNFQLSAGYNFNSVLGARVSVNGWTSKAGSTIDGQEYSWKWNYVAPMVDATINLSNAIFGYKPARLVNVGVFAGLGVNVGFNNERAQHVSDVLFNKYASSTASGTYYNGTSTPATFTIPSALVPNADQWLRYLWNGPRARLVGRVGATVDFRICDAVSLGLEGSFNMLNDHYNSKQAPNPDFYYNVLAGVKINLGATHETKVIEVPTAKIIERVIEKQVAPVQQQIIQQGGAAGPNTGGAAVAQQKKEPLRREVFFPAIRSTNIPADQMSKVEDVANYLKKYPEAKVTITGYADRGTGNPTINKGYGDKRAQAVKTALINTYGISASRITTIAVGDAEQPFENNDSNRVSICIAE